MALSKIQSIVARLSHLEDAFVKGNPGIGEEVLEAKFRKERNELLNAGMRELAGHDGVTVEEIAAEKFAPQPIVISVVGLASGEPGPASLGPYLAEKLNACRKDHWVGLEEQFLQEVRPEDIQCTRSLRMVRSLLTSVALDQSNTPPGEALDPITPAELAAFAFPGGLLSELGRKGVAPAPGR